MKELNDLLEALERWYIEGNQYEAEKYLRAEYRTYKAVAPPLVLEAVEWVELGEGDIFYYRNLINNKPTDLVLSRARKDKKQTYLCPCYRIPNGGNDERAE